MDRTLKRWVDVESHLKADTAFGFIDRSTSSSQLFHPKLITNNGNDTMLAAIKAELRRSTSFTFSVAFVSSQAVATLKQALLEFTGTGTIITSTYLSFNTPGAFKELLNIPGVEVYVFDEESGFHPKGYVFQQHQTTTAIVGSSNLTATALSKNSEWNLRFSAMPDGDIVTQLQVAIEDQLKKAKPLTHEWIADYEKRYVPPERRRVIAPSSDELRRQYDEEPAIVANEMQQEALVEIQKVRDQGEKRAIVVSATGTGKTILAALDVQAVAPRRMLFVVHREQIIDRAIQEFKRVLRAPDTDFGKYVGGSKEIDRKYVFASVQSLSKEEVLQSLPRDTFDYVLIDEVHRAGAESYIRLIDYFTPKFLLGFTATPERTDGINLFEIFDFNVPFEIRLQEALSREMLSPFHYYGVADYETADGEVISDASHLAQLVLPERVDHIVSALEKYGHVGEPVRGLMFCSRKAEAHELSTALNVRSVHGNTLRTVALTGEDSAAMRETQVQRLERGELDYIITVDVFNEGIDIPSLNQVVMLRQTESSIIFTQQLGRGLRKAKNKDHLRVIDFIGNYTNNFLIPIALFGDNSLNKDSVRRHLRDADETGVISGISSVNFDEISKQRVFASLAMAKLDSMVNLKKTYISLEYRLGRPPMLIDFARFDAADPVVIATKHHSYWNFLHKVKAVDFALHPAEDAILKFLAAEVLNGKRPHELLVLQTLLDQGSLDETEVIQLLVRQGCAIDKQTIDSVKRILNLEFYTAPERKKYGAIPLVTHSDSRWIIDKSFQARFRTNPVFASHVLDAIETGLYLARHKYSWSQSLVIGERYSRKDVCRLMNWKSNEQGSIFGYKVDFTSNSCPIFITYHKDDDVSASTKYGDKFVNETLLHWFTRSKRTLQSPEVKSIVNNELPLHVFAKKDDAEGLDFYYLGEATSSNATQTIMPGDHGQLLPVVTMDLHLHTPLERTLFDYLTTPTSS